MGPRLNSQSSVLNHQDLIDAAEQVAPLPATMTRLLTLTNDPNSSMQDMAEVIRFDPILTGDVLRQANSARSAVRDPIVEVSTAAARLGASDVLALGMMRAMQGRMTVALPAYGMDAHDLWEHSLKAALAAEVIAELSAIRISGHASTAALLHDIGKLVIAKALPQGVADHLAGLIASEPSALVEIERSILGVDHGEVGAVVVRSWNMPMSIQIALTNHHGVGDSGDPLSHVVAAANAIAHALPNLESTDHGPLDHLTLASLNEAGIVASKVPLLLDCVSSRVELLVSSYGI